LPSNRELGDAMRSLFPDKSKLIHLQPEGLRDPQTVVELLSVSDADIVEDIPADTRSGRSPTPANAAAPQPARPRSALSQRHWRPWLAPGGAAAIVALAGGTWALRRAEPPAAPRSEPPQPSVVPASVSVAPPGPEATPRTTAVAEQAPAIASRSPAAPARRAPARLPSDSKPPPVPAGPPKGPQVSRSTGWLTIETYPWAHVREGATALGITPLRMELAAGRHRIVLENDQLHVTRSVWITVKPGVENSYSAGLDQLPK
jgi:hypothetical protein